MTNNSNSAKFFITNFSLKESSKNFLKSSIEILLYQIASIVIEK